MTDAELTTIKSWQTCGLTVVLVTGVFDLLHVEHIRFLTQAKAAGDKLVVGLESDARVRSIKSHERPVNNQTIRQEQLQALKAVDLVFLLPERFSTQADWENLMATLKPDIYAVSSHTSHLENKIMICGRFGIQFKVVHQFNPDYSSTSLYQKLLRTQ